MMDSPFLLVPGAAQREAQRSDAPQTRDPVDYIAKTTGVPHLRCTAWAVHRVRDTRSSFI